MMAAVYSVFFYPSPTLTLFVVQCITAWMLYGGDVVFVYMQVAVKHVCRDRVTEWGSLVRFTCIFTSR